MKTFLPIVAALAIQLVSTLPAQAQKSQPEARMVLPIVKVDYGTWGPLKKIGGQPVEYDRMVSGELDPRPVPAGLTGAKASAAHLARAEGLLRIGRIEQMLDALAAAIKADPNNVAALHLRGRYYLFKKDHNAALGDIFAAIRVSGKSPSADLYASRAHALFVIGEIERAIKDAHTAIKIQPGHEVAAHVLVDYMMANGEHDEAAKILVDMLKTKSGDPALLKRAGVVFAQLGRQNDAEAAYTALIELEPQIFTTVRGRANARIAQGNYKGALADYNKILGIGGIPGMMAPFGPMAAQLLMERAVIKHQLGLGDQSTEDLTAVMAQGGLNMLLKLQIGLRNHGFTDVALTGTPSAKFASRLNQCIASAPCRKVLLPVEPSERNNAI